jgi:hypothetical protein
MGILEESEADEDTNIPEEAMKNLMEIINRINV